MRSDLVERLRRISDTICDAIIEHQQPQVQLSDANVIDKAATEIERLMKALERAEFWLGPNTPIVVLDEISTALTEGRK